MVFVCLKSLIDQAERTLLADVTTATADMHPLCRVRLADRWAEFVAELKTVAPGDEAIPASVARLLSVLPDTDLLTVFQCWLYYRTLPEIDRAKQAHRERSRTRWRASLGPAGCDSQLRILHRTISRAQPGRILALAEEYRLVRLYRQQDAATASILSHPEPRR